MWWTYSIHRLPFYPPATRDSARKKKERNLWEELKDEEYRMPEIGTKINDKVKAKFSIIVGLH